MDVDESRMLTVGQAAEHLGVSPATVRRLSARGELEEHRTGGSHRRFHSDDVERVRMSRAIEESKEALSDYRDPGEDRLRPSGGHIRAPRGEITFDASQEAILSAPEELLDQAMLHRRELQSMMATLRQSQDLVDLSGTVRRMQQALAPVLDQHREVLKSISDAAIMPQAAIVQDLAASVTRAIALTGFDKSMADIQASAAKQFREAHAKWSPPEMFGPGMRADALSAANSASAHLSELFSGITAFPKGEPSALQQVFGDISRAWEPFRNDQKLIETIQTAAAAIQGGLGNRRWLEDLYPQLPEDKLEEFGLALVDHGWVLPRSLPDDLRDELWELFIEDRLVEAEVVLVAHYSVDGWAPVFDIAAAWYDRNCFAEVKATIRESLAAARAELYHPAVATLIDQIEGVITRYVVINNVPLPAECRDDRTFMARGPVKAKAVLQHCDSATSEEERDRRHLGSLLGAMYAWADFRAMIEHPDQFDAVGVGRHPISHGIAVDGYGTPGQFLRTVFVLDRLAEIVGHPGTV